MNYVENHFEEVVRKIFTKAGYTVSNDIAHAKYEFDFLAEKDKTAYGIEVKMQPRSYHEIVPTMEYIIRMTTKAAKNRNLSPVIVFNGIIAKTVKDELERNYHELIIVDISNLIAAVPPHTELRTELLAAIPYSIDEIKPQESDALPSWIQHGAHEESLIKELENCVPGKAGFRDFEKICTDILKATFNDQLTLWKEQKTSNNNLYRFDLLCRIKDSHNSTFWNIVERNFFSKYVVFEYKNHRSQIKQEQIYTTEKYLYSKALRTVAIVVSQHGADANAQWAAKGAFRESGKLILLIDAKDLEIMLKMKLEGDDPSELFLEKLDNLLMELEK